jgi:hypothetical protein
LQNETCCYANKRIATGIWYTYVAHSVTYRCKEMTMSKTASIALSSPTTWFGRLLALIDHVLMTNARIADRNGDLPYFGL